MPSMINSRESLPANIKIENKNMRFVKYKNSQDIIGGLQSKKLSDIKNHNLEKIHQNETHPFEL